MKKVSLFLVVAVIPCLIAFTAQVSLASIYPDTVWLALSPGESAPVVATVIVPSIIPVADILFSFDLTGSMEDEISVVKAQAYNIMVAINGLISDVKFGVISYMDYPHFYDTCGYANIYGDPDSGDYAYLLNQPLTSDTALVRTIIEGLVMWHGGDYPQDYERIFFESYADSVNIGYRPDAKKILINFGDCLPHDCNLSEGIEPGVFSTGSDPGRDEIMGNSDDLDLQTTLAGMAAHGISLLEAHASVNCEYLNYWQYWCSLTGGAFALLGNASQIPAVIESLVRTQALHIDSLYLKEMTPGFESWLASVVPPYYLDITTPDTLHFNETITVPPDIPYDSINVFIIRAIEDGISCGDQTVIVGFFPPQISTLCPERGGADCDVDISIVGSHYYTGAHVKLVRSENSEDTIPGNSICVSHTKIIARFGLAGQPIGSVWNLIVTNPNMKADTLYSAFRIVSPSELSPKDVLCVLSSNHERIQDFQANAKAWSKFNGEPLDSIIHSHSLYKSPDKVKNIDYANDDTTQVISTVINRGWLQYEIDPDSGYAYATNLLQVAQMTPSEFAGLNFYYPDNFLFHHYVTIKDIHEYPDSLIFVLEAIPKRAEWTYSKLELEIDYSRGLVVKSTVYSDTVVQQTVAVTEEQLIDGIWLGTKSIKTTADTSETLQTEIELSNIQNNVGIPDSIFYPAKIKQIEVEPESTYQEVEMPPLPKYIGDQWKNENVYKPNPILFLHGFALGNPKSWEKVMEKFNEYMEPYYATGPDCYVYCPDFRTHPGANASIDGPGGWGDSTCQNIIARLDTLSGVPIEYRPFKVNIVAHSAGGLGARECVTDPAHSGFYNLVDKIITTGTPHLGSELTYVGQRLVGFELGLIQLGMRYPNPWIIGGVGLGAGIILVANACLHIDPAGEIETDMTPGSVFYQNLYSRPQHEDKIKYYAISCTYPPGPWSGLLPGADDWVVSDSSQLGIGRPGDFDFHHYLAGYGRGRAKHWEGETDSSFGHIRRFLDLKPDVLITKPEPNDSIAEACTLRIELHNEYLPATTWLEVNMTRVGESEPIFDTSGYLFKPDTSWRAVGPNSIKSGRYDTTIALSKAPPGKYLITVRVKNPAGLEDEASVEIILGVDLLTQIGGGQARRGFNKNYGIDYSNIGNAKASNITVEAGLPPQVSYVSSSPPGNLSGNTVYWNFDSLIAGASGGVSVTVYVPNLPQGTILHATSNITTTDEDVDLSNNPSEVSDLVVGSWDPNGKEVQPMGKGDRGYIAEGQELHYTVFFENVDTATAEAVNIVVVDTLDPNLSWNSLRFGPMSHPDKCSTSFDPVSGVIIWQCDSIMLPPDTLPPAGEGWVTFTISPQYLQHGTEIKNRASIQFDFNPWMYAPIDSSYIINTMDEYPPNSRVLPLWDTVSAIDFEVNWKGQDDSLGFGCGIRDYTIYVSDNGGPYEVWITDTSDTFATYHGQFAHTYCFYTIAEDSVGNIEEAPPTPDASTRIPTYIRGDANNSGVIELGDVVYLITYLYKSGPAPVPLLTGDANCSGEVELGDVVYLISYLYKGGPPPSCK